MTNIENRIDRMAATMVAFAIKGKKVSKAEKVALMVQAMAEAEKLVKKQIEVEAA